MDTLSFMDFHTVAALTSPASILIKVHIEVQSWCADTVTICPQQNKIAALETMLTSCGVHKIVYQHFLKKGLVSMESTELGP